MVKSRNRDAHFHLIPYNMEGREGPRYTEPVNLFSTIFLLIKSGVRHRQMTKYETMILARLVGKG